MENLGPFYPNIPFQPTYANLPPGPTSVVHDDFDPWGEEISIRVEWPEEYNPNPGKEYENSRLTNPKIEFYDEHSDDATTDGGSVAYYDTSVATAVEFKTADSRGIRLDLASGGMLGNLTNGSESILKPPDCEGYVYIEWPGYTFRRYKLEKHETKDLTSIAMGVGMRFEMFIEKNLGMNVHPDETEWEVGPNGTLAHDLRLVAMIKHAFTWHLVMYHRVPGSSDFKKLPNPPTLCIEWRTQPPSPIDKTIVVPHLASIMYSESGPYFRPLTQESPCEGSGRLEGGVAGPEVISTHLGREPRVDFSKEYERYPWKGNRGDGLVNTANSAGFGATEYLSHLGFLCAPVPLDGVPQGFRRDEPVSITCAMESMKYFWPLGGCPSLYIKWPGYGGHRVARYLKIYCGIGEGPFVEAVKGEFRGFIQDMQHKSLDPAQVEWKVGPGGIEDRHLNIISMSRIQEGWLLQIDWAKRFAKPPSCHPNLTIEWETYDDVLRTIKPIEVPGTDWVGSTCDYLRRMST